MEEVAGVDSSKVIYCHGSLTKAKCLTCNKETKAADILDVVRDGNVPLCQNEKKGKKRKLNDVNNTTTTTTIEEGEKEEAGSPPVSREPRTRRTSSRLPSIPIEQPLNPKLCNGTLKPNITFFGESLQSSFEKSLTKDAKLVDLLIVIGTSLTVSPVNRIPGFLDENVKKVLINRNVVRIKKTDGEKNSKLMKCSARNMFDLSLLGDCDAVLANVYPSSEMEVGAEKVTTTHPSNETDYKSVDEDSSVFLFENGVYEPPTFEENNIISVKREMKEEEQEELVEVVTCDICTLSSTSSKCLPFYECLNCFDYALCDSCYEHKSKTHFNGDHRFIAME